MTNLITVLYLISAVFFILALRGLSSPVLARRGNMFGMVGMLLVIVTTLMLPNVVSYKYIVIALILGGSLGSLIAWKTNMKQLPQLMALFHSLVGLAAAIIAVTVFYNPQAFHSVDELLHTKELLYSTIELSIGLFIGVVTFAGSLIAFAKLQGIMGGEPIVLPFHKFLNLLMFLGIIAAIVALCYTQAPIYLWIITVVSFIFGITLIIPVGGADMPVVVSMLNSYSGWATAGIGFTLSNPVLIIVGAIVGSSGAILSYIMCKGMNRSIFNVIFGATNGGGNSTNVAGAAGNSNVSKPYNRGSGEDAAFMMQNSSSVIIVPGYGMAVSGAQHALKEMTLRLKEAGVSVKFAIHPVAGRMPGHMNVLLAEAGIPYEDVYEMETINSEFAQTDIVYVIGANDVTNPAAKNDTSSPIYGMPVLEVDKAKTVFFVKRSMGTGYSGIDNQLFYDSKTVMLLGDAKEVTERIIAALD